MISRFGTVSNGELGRWYASCLIVFMPWLKSCPCAVVHLYFLGVVCCLHLALS